MPITAGFVSAHHHLNSTLARGMPAPPTVPTSFREVLEQVWWRLEAALDLDLLRWSVLLGAVEALESGTTAIVDHHESPAEVDGSLDVIAEACAEVGVRVVCAYSVTDRHGPAGVAAALAENDRFLARGGRGLVGLHAAFTCSDATIESAAGLAVDHGVGVHVHVAEAPEDVGEHGAERLRGFARDDWVLAHCVHLTDPMAGVVVHNPRSNLVNAVGYARPARFDRVALGTDGIGASMLDEFALAHALHRSDATGAAPSAAWGWLEGGYAIVPEARDDEVAWSGVDRVDPGYLAFTPGGRAERVVIDGEVVVDGGTVTKVDGERIRARAWEEAEKLWRRL